MAAPTFVASYQTGTVGSAYNSVATLTKSASVTSGVGDILVAVAVTEDDSSHPISSISGGWTWTLQRKLTVPANNVSIAMYTATGTAATNTVTLTLTGTAPNYCGMTVYRFSGSNGIGAVNSSNGTGSAPSLSITTTQANSALVWVSGDWSATNTARTWLTVNSLSAQVQTDEWYNGVYSAASAYWADAGAIGAKTAGLSAPNQTWQAAVIEVKGAAGGGGPAFNAAWARNANFLIGGPI
jgi:hypothetical protein